MGFKVKQECPQCGAPFEFDEIDHLLCCPYCNVKSFLFTPDYFRYVLPHKTPAEDIVFVPYLRFKGNVYYCYDKTIDYRFVDFTRLVTPINGLPLSLGLRPQAMKVRFINPDLPGSFLECQLKVADALKACKQLSGAKSKELLHHAFIGDSLSLIYLPLTIRNDTIFDGVLNRHMGKLSAFQDIFKKAVEYSSAWRHFFIATLCPHCGWNLDGERDSVVLTCSNCATAWEASMNRFVQVSCSFLPDRQKNSYYLPFWKIKAGAKGIEINSFADFIRASNQPMVIQKQWEDQEMTFWTPAFKISSKIFLLLSKQLTITLKEFETKTAIPEKNLYPVTLPKSEAVQSLKLILASSAIIKNKIFPLLPEVRFSVKDISLVYLPFMDNGYEMILERPLFSINKKALEFGHHL